MLVITKRIYFYIEDFDVTSKRNACKEVKISKLHTENTDRKQMTMVAMFEYMIGNTDWSVYANHNIKLMQDSAAGRITHEERARIESVHLVAFYKGTLHIAFAVGALSLAAIFTVLLIFSSRRATLRQVNASLIEIAAQLKQLRAERNQDAGAGR